MPRDANALAALDVALARPLVEDCIPKPIEDRAIALFEEGSLAITGHRWKWAESSDEIRNKWRLRAFIEYYDYTCNS